jgi:uncharacterized protein (DUF305 family)
MTAHTPATSSPHSPYARLGLMVGLSFIAMYALMYAMVDSWPNVYISVNQIYMAGLMAAPMALIELVLMGGMYKNRRLNIIVVATSVAALALFWILIRQQAAVSDKQFLRSMIPHHAGAILMCEEAPVEDSEIKALCQAILSGQQAEIAQMKAKLGALEK